MTHTHDCSIILVDNGFVVQSKYPDKSGKYKTLVARDFTELGIIVKEYIDEVEKALKAEKT